MVSAPMNDREAQLTAELCAARVDLDRAMVQLAEAHKMAALGRLLAGVVHEINSPIGSILSNNEVLLRSFELLDQAVQADPARARRILETCCSLAAVDKIACDRICSVVRGLKTFAREDSSDLRKADINEILANTLKLTHCEFRSRIQVETDFAELPEIECYPHMLNQVFLNILVNAAQAIEGEGKVTVRTALEDQCVRVSISDTGSGIPPASRARIFSPGFSTKPVGVGTGLGLSISRQIVEEKHGGAIGFETEMGRGTTFHVRLPLAQARRAAG
ncbi:MAG: ATPase [Acidobacteria bacterium]|nr:ATPase [Acidobacteriota bacterium]